MAYAHFRVSTYRRKTVRDPKKPAIQGEFGHMSTLKVPKTPTVKMP